jgi:hypothetical protein
MLVETIAIKSTASRRDAMLVKSMIDVDLPTFRPYGTRCFSWTLFSTNILPLTGLRKMKKTFIKIPLIYYDKFYFLNLAKNALTHLLKRHAVGLSDFLPFTGASWLSPT